MDEGGEAMWGGLYEQGRIGGHLEEIFQYDSHDPESYKGAFEYMMDAVQTCANKGWPIGLGYLPLTFPALPRELVDPVISDELKASLFRFQRKIKQAFDPNTASDAGAYLMLKEPEGK